MSAVSCQRGLFPWLIQGGSIDQWSQDGDDVKITKQLEIVQVNDLKNFFLKKFEINKMCCAIKMYFLHAMGMRLGDKMLLRRGGQPMFIGSGNKF